MLDELGRGVRRCRQPGPQEGPRLLRRAPRRQHRRARDAARRRTCAGRGRLLEPARRADGRRDGGLHERRSRPSSTARTRSRSRTRRSSNGRSTSSGTRSRRAPATRPFRRGWPHSRPTRTRACRTGPSRRRHERRSMRPSTRTGRSGTSTSTPARARTATRSRRPSVSRTRTSPSAGSGLGLAPSDAPARGVAGGRPRREARRASNACERSLAADGLDAYFGIRPENSRYLTGFELGDGEEKVSRLVGPLLRQR